MTVSCCCPETFVWPLVTKRLLEHYNYSSANFSVSWKTIPQLVLGSRHTGQCVSLLYLFDVTSHHNEIPRSSPCTVISHKIGPPFSSSTKLCLFFWKHAHLFKQISLTVFEVCILLRRKYHNSQKYAYPSLPLPPPSLRSHLSSSFMGTFLRDYGMGPQYTFLPMQIPILPWSPTNQWAIM